MSASLYRSFNRAGEFLERHASTAAAILFLFVILAGLAQASNKPLGNDEVYTYLAAALPGWSGVWGFFAHGADTPSPLPALFVHPLLHFSANTEIITRLPFDLAFAVMCLCLYVFMRRAYPAGYALAALIAPVVLPFFFYYSSEDRAYAFLLAGTAFAIVCWQAANQPGARKWSAAGMWLGLAFAICAHIFAIFLIVPFALAQIMADRERKRINVPVWTALVLFPLGILPVLHGELVASHAFRSSFFSKPSPAMLQSTYKSFFSQPYEACIALLLFAVFALLFYRAGAASEQQAAQRGLTRPEIAFAAALSFMPLYVVPAAMLLGVYREPYSLPALIGIVICVIAAVAELSHRQIALAAALFVSLLLAVCAKTASMVHLRTLAHPQRVHENIARAYDLQPWVQLAASSPLPVVMANPNSYTQARFYLPEAIQHRLWYITDLALIRRYPESSSTQISIIRTGKFVFLPSMAWEDFAARYPHFLLVNSSPEDAWLPGFLAQQPRDHIKIELLGPDFSGFSVYDVQVLNPAQPQASANP